MVDGKLAWLGALIRNKAHLIERIPAHLRPDYKPPTLVRLRKDDLDARLRIEFERGRWAGYDGIANFLNSLDTSEMTVKELRSAIYTECLVAPTRPARTHDDDR